MVLSQKKKESSVPSKQYLFKKIIYWKQLIYSETL